MPALPVRRLSLPVDVVGRCRAMPLRARAAPRHPRRLAGGRLDVHSQRPCPSELIHADQQPIEPGAQVDRHGVLARLVAAPDGDLEHALAIEPDRAAIVAAQHEPGGHVARCPQVGQCIGGVILHAGTKLFLQVHHELGGRVIARRQPALTTLPVQGLQPADLDGRRNVGLLAGRKLRVQPGHGRGRNRTEQPPGADRGEQPAVVAEQDLPAVHGHADAHPRQGGAAERVGLPLDAGRRELAGDGRRRLRPRGRGRPAGGGNQGRLQQRRRGGR